MFDLSLQAYMGDNFISNKQRHIMTKRGRASYHMVLIYGNIIDNQVQVSQHGFPFILNTLQVTNDYVSHYGLPGSDVQNPDIPPPEIDERTPFSAFTSHHEPPQTQDEIDAQFRKDKENVYK